MFTIKSLTLKPDYILIETRKFPIFPRVVFAMFPKNSISGFVPPDIFSLNMLDCLVKTAFTMKADGWEGMMVFKQPIIMSYLFMLHIKKEKLYDTRKFVRLKRKIQFFFDIINFGNMLCRHGKYYCTN